MRTIRRRRRNPTSHSYKVAILTKFFGPGNVRGSRMVADAGMGRRVSVHYAHGLNGDENHARAAEALCKKMGWTGNLIGGALGDNKGMAWVFTS